MFGFFNKYFFCRIVALLVVVAVSVIDGENALALFKCDSADGKHFYVSSPEECAGKYENYTIKPVPKPKSKSAANKRKSNTKIPSRKQRAMDKERREILEYELNEEMQKYQAIQEKLQSDKTLATNERQFLITQQTEHIRNIRAIRSELNRLPGGVSQLQELSDIQKEQKRRRLIEKLKNEARKQFALRQLILIQEDAEKRARLIEQHDQHARSIIEIKRQLIVLGKPNFSDSANANHSSN